MSFSAGMRPSCPACSANGCYRYVGVEWDEACAAEAADDLNWFDRVCAATTVPPAAQASVPPELGDGYACGDPIAVIG